MARSQTTSRPQRLRALLVALGVASCLSCGQRPAPNVVLVCIDTLRADALGAYGGPLPTPAFDGLASDGVLFEQAIAPASQTAPSHATLFSGRDVLHHGLVQNGLPLDEAEETLAQVFHAAGYATGGFVSSVVLDERFGWARGFEHYDAEFSKQHESLRHRWGVWKQFASVGFDRPAAYTNAKALPWLASAPEPFFLFVHYFDPHAPYHADPELLKQIPRSIVARPAAERIDALRASLPEMGIEQLRQILWNYHGEVMAVDRALGALLNGLERRGIRDRTLVVVTADHGEGLGQHGTLDHTPHVYEEQIHVPLALRWPGELERGMRIRQPVGLVDVAPTVAELARVAFTHPPDGRSLVPALRSGAMSETRPLFGQRRHFAQPMRGQRGTQFFVRTERWKYIRATEDPDELYDLEADPRELHNLRDERPDSVVRLGAILDAFLARYPNRATPVAIPDDVRHDLEALGYVD